MRAAAVVLSLSMLHLNAVRADAACASHPEAERAAPPAATDHHAHHGDASQAPASDASDSEDCEAPVARDCCVAVASCGVALEIQLSDVPAVVGPASRLLLPAGLETPSGVDLAPEPPPPRA